MKPAFHYFVKARYIRKKDENNEIEFVDLMEEFFDKEPIEARNKAFRYYENYIHVFLISKGITDSSDRQAITALDSFFDPKTSYFKVVNGIEVNIPNVSGNGIGVFMVINQRFIFDENSQNMMMLHGVGYLNDDPSAVNPAMIALWLEREYKYYKHFGYKTKGQEKSIKFFNYVEWGRGNKNQPREFTILPTPFNWSGLDKHDWDEGWWKDLKSDDELSANSKTKLTVESIIQSGESNTVEFKPSLVYNF